MNHTVPKNESRSCRSWCSARKAFTLIELLVTIAVLTILGSLLLPALSKSKKAAHRIRCVSNLRQLGFAVQLYWDDNDGRAFRYGGSLTNGGRLYWFGWMQNGSEGARQFDAEPGALYPYLYGRGVVTCPSLDYNMAQFKLKANGASYGYGYNMSLSALPLEPAVNVHSLSAPADVVALADSAQINTFQAPASPENPMLEEFYYVSTNATEKTAHFRHEQKANAVFCDGHVSAEKPIPGSLDTTLPGQFVGRLKTEILIPR